MPDTNQVVFVVDDEPVIAQTLAVILNHAGFQAMAFDHPDEAISARAELRPELFISDVMMPGMTGVELALNFVKPSQNARCSFSLGKAQPPIFLKEAREQGYEFDLVSKPAHPADL